MAEIRGFRGFAFDAAKTGALDAVLTPPYDVIEPHERDRLAAGSPYNMTHLTLPVASGGLSPHAGAAAAMEDWIRQGALVQDAEPRLYLLRQRYAAPDGREHERRGFFALLRLPEAGEQFILGHERTFEGPVEDRLELMRATHANVEPIFVMYSDPGLRLSERLFDPMNAEAPCISAKTADSVFQELWRADCPEELVRHFEDQVLYIADGHHRFKTACIYRDERRRTDADHGPDRAYNYIMAGFVAFEEPGLNIYAAHRVVPAAFQIPFETLRERLAHYFAFRKLSAGEAHEGTLAGGDSGCHFVLHTADAGPWLISLDESKRNDLLATQRHQAWRDLDVAVLHRGILERLIQVPADVALRYEKDDRQAAALVERGEASLAFLLRPTRPEQVRACAEVFEPMPQKSTYYFPKMPSGAVLHKFD